jgi:plasmid stability protein
MAVAIQIKDVPEEVRDALAARAEARGQSTQTYLRSLLEREYQAQHNRQLLEALAGHRSLTMTAEEVAAVIRTDRDR